MIGLNDLVVGMNYIHNGETVFTYVGIGDNELSDHNIVLECGTESFLVGGDCITNINWYENYKGNNHRSTCDVGIW